MKLLAAQRPWTGRTVLITLMITFGIIFAVNGVFVFYAISTWPGLSQNDAYESGLRYNEVIRAAREQKELDWRVDFSVMPSGQIQVHLAGSDNGQIDLARAEMVIERPLGDPATRVIKLTQDSNGSFATRMAPLPAGLWHATLMIEGADGRAYHMQHVVEVRP